MADEIYNFQIESQGEIVIYEHADAGKLFMGLISFSGDFRKEHKKEIGEELSQNETISKKEIIQQERKRLVK